MNQTQKTKQNKTKQVVSPQRKDSSEVFFLTFFKKQSYLICMKFEKISTL